MATPRGQALLHDGLVVLAQFEDGHSVLASRDIERLAGVSRSAAHQCLLKLSGLGYVSRAPHGRFRLAGRPVGIRVRRGENGTTITPP
ncbi:MAG: helix-turn-helix domain-containing protein [Arthrospira platensis]